MQIIIIAAIAQNGVMGKDNKIPWHYKEDFQHFKQLTLNHVIVMGRKTYESIGKPLPGRTNIVVSRNKNLHCPGCILAASSHEAVRYAQQHNAEKLFIIGGSSLYEEGLKIADILELTFINRSVEGDTYFPEWNKKSWRETKREDHDEFSFVTFQRERTP